MAIRGFFPTGFHSTPAPCVQAYLVLPRLNIDALITFLIDSGADDTTLSLIDVERMSLRYRRLRRSSTAAVEGIAGQQTFYQEEGMLMMRDDDGNMYSFTVNVDIPRKGSRLEMEQQRRLPSLLGRDVTNQCTLTVCYQDGKVELTPPEGSKLPPLTRRLI